MDKAKLFYFFLLILRFVLTLLPQTGYIHPDEFFQGPEIIYGDMFQLQTFRSWEFETESPIRSVTFPYLIVGIPAAILKAIDQNELLKIKFLPYLLLMLPRLFMCCISLIQDLCLYKLNKKQGSKPFSILNLLGSSHIAIVYFTRTFSNSIEAACFSFLYYLSFNEIFNKKLVKPSKNKENLPKEGVSHYYIFGILIAMGCFMRPTFLFFSVVPMLFLLKASWHNKRNVILKLLDCILGTIATTLFFSFIDTIYYSQNINKLIDPINIAETLQKLIFTPLNFVTYNLNVKNLSSHGHHPWYLHFLVNIPLNFSLLGFYGVWHSIRMLLKLCKRQNPDSIELFHTLCFVVPIILLSVFPHQEPRFLIPVMFPLLCLCGSTFIRHCSKFKLLGILWLTTNALGIAFYGYFHQGGMVQALNYFHKETLKSSNSMDLIFYRTYMPPRHLLPLKKDQNLIKAHDLAGTSDDVLLSRIQLILKNKSHNNKIYLIIPSTVVIPIVNVNIMLNPNYRLKLERKFFPHLSMEDLPPLHNIWNLMKSRSSFYYRIRKMKDFFCLNIYRLEPLSKHKN